MREHVGSQIIPDKDVLSLGANTRSALSPLYHSLLYPWISLRPITQLQLLSGRNTATWRRLSASCRMRPSRSMISSKLYMLSSSVKKCSTRVPSHQATNGLVFARLEPIFLSLCISISYIPQHFTDILWSTRSTAGELKTRTIGISFHPFGGVL